MFKKRWVSRKRIKAVHNENLEGLLSSFGILNQIKSEEFNCSICNVKINLDNLSVLFAKDDKLHFICSHPHCIAQLEIPEEASYD